MVSTATAHLLATAGPGGGTHQREVTPGRGKWSFVSLFPIGLVTRLDSSSELCKSNYVINIC